MKSKLSLPIPSMKETDSNTIRNFTKVIFGIDIVISLDNIIPNKGDEIQIFNIPTNPTDERLFLSLLNTENKKKFKYTVMLITARQVRLLI